MKKHNLHIHTIQSDGSLTLSEIINLAKKTDLEVIGITDHAFTSKLDPGNQIRTMDRYFSSFDECISDKNIIIKKGIEIDASLNYGSNLKYLPFDKLNQLDYILFEYVNTEEETWGRVEGRDISEIVQIKDRLTIPVGLAHNDLQYNYCGKEEEIAKILGQEKIFVELNQNQSGNLRGGKSYFLYFSDKLIDALRNENVKFVIGTDSHHGEFLNQTDIAERFMKLNNLQPHELIK